jgi:hypothetical protein
MKNAVWLFLYFVVNANRGTGVLLRKIRTISRDMGVSRDLTMRWLTILRQGGYIVTVNTGRYLTIQVKNWKPLRKDGYVQPQKWEPSRPSGCKYPTPSQRASTLFPVHSDAKSGALPRPNDTKIQRLLNDDNRDLEPIGPYAKQEMLAWELANALDDPAGIHLYRSYCRKYPERLLRDVLAEVRELPGYKVKKGRGALFNYLIQQHAQRTTKNSGR